MNRGLVLFRVIIVAVLVLKVNTFEFMAKVSIAYALYPLYGFTYAHSL